MRVELVIHPDASCPAVDGITVNVARMGQTLVGLAFVVSGDIRRVRIPAPAMDERTDELWRHTCFELFVRTEGDGYLEFNFAPSGQWAAYRFDSYREGMAHLDIAAPRIRAQMDGGAFELNVELDLAGAGVDLDAAPGIALTAVIETVAGDKSYWSLAHAPGKPDFHHPASFTAEFPTEISELEPR